MMLWVVASLNLLRFFFSSSSCYYILEILLFWLEYKLKEAVAFIPGFSFFFFVLYILEMEDKSKEAVAFIYLFFRILHNVYKHFLDL